MNTTARIPSAAVAFATSSSLQRMLTKKVAGGSRNFASLMPFARIGSAENKMRHCNYKMKNNHRHIEFLQLQAFNNDANSDDDNNPTATEPEEQEPMVNLFAEWTYEQDKTLWENRDKSTSALAALLGRGLRGVEARLSKLKDTNTKAYERLFADKNKGDYKDDEEDEDENNIPGEKKKTHLVPVSEVLRRLKWDVSLPREDFSLLYYDRVEDKVMESPLDAPNTSISGKETSFVDALPEHRIVGIRYKERVVWDREERLDLFFGGDIEKVMAEYDDWKRDKDAVEEWNRQRQEMVSEKLRMIMGIELFGELKQLASNFISSVQEDVSVSKQAEAEHFVKSALEIFRYVRSNPSTSPDPSLIPMSDLLALDCLSELVALLPEKHLRGTLLSEVSLAMDKLDGRGGGGKQVSKAVSKSRQLPELNEAELTESFVRGTGPGGQKINKTNNKVVLVHEPTQLRVECQDTRSLQQNRKIARKRLQLKLDEYLNGSQSRTKVKAQLASKKKAKAKARSRARQQKKQKSKLLEADNDNSDDQV